MRVLHFLPFSLDGTDIHAMLSETGSKKFIFLARRNLVNVTRATRKVINVLKNVMYTSGTTSNMVLIQVKLGSQFLYFNFV
jgi:hypothetical protein